MPRPRLARAATIALMAILGWLGATAVNGVLAPPAAAALPTDPQVGAQEPLRVLRVGEALDRAGRPLADVPVLTPDTGLDLQHPDIQPRLFSLPAAVAAPNPGGGAGTVQAGASGWDLIGTLVPPNLAPDADPDDPAGRSGHGTLVAGVLGAAHNNAQGGAGVAPNARFVALRTCWDGDQCYQYVQDDAINWAADRGARVVSLSWLSGPLEAELRAAIVNHPNVLFVTIPSGNGGAYDADPENPLPCNLDAPNVLCVSTSAPGDGLDCGAYGPRSVDVAVPTRNSVTTRNGGSFGPTGCATSYASPTAAGVATILFGIAPAASAAEVKAAIVDSARKVPAWAGKSVSGGIVDAAAAVSLLQQRRGITPPTGPTGPGPGSGSTRCSGRRATIVGTSGKDTLRGTRRSDVIVALGGNDVIRAGAGNDLVCAGSGNDRVAGSSGKDRLYGQSGNDRVSGGSSNDRLDGGSGNDRLTGDSGRDALLGGSGRDRLLGSGGKDSCNGGAGRDRASCERERRI